MNRFVLRMPDDLYQTVRKQADREGVSINQYLLYTITRGVTVEETRAFFAAKSDPSAVAAALAILDRVPDVDPEHPDDRAPSRSLERSSGDQKGKSSRQSRRSSR